MSDIRIFSYLPNPRLFKATIAARFNGVDIDVTGAPPRELGDWLWDFEPRLVSDLSEAEKAANERVARTGFSGKLYKTDRFLEANPYGTVPCAFSPDGSTGLFESNSILRAVARLGQERVPLYGRDVFEASRIDAFLDTALIFARDSQIYLLAIGRKDLTPDVHSATQSAYRTWLGGIEQALAGRQWLVGDAISAADICFVCEFALVSRDRAARRILEPLGLTPITDLDDYPNVAAHISRLGRLDEVHEDLGSYLETFV
jgi:glutathione S-transferase